MKDKKLVIFLCISITFNIVFLFSLLPLFFNNLSNACMMSPSPLDDPAYIHVLEKKDENYLVSYFYGNCKGYTYVGKSTVALNSYLGKPVIIEGAWAKHSDDFEAFSRKEQCILSACHIIFPQVQNARAQVVDIYNLRIATDQ